MLKNLFKKDDDVKEEDVFAPVSGQVVDLSEVPDPTFSEKMMGDGVALKPTDGKFVSPIDAEVVNLFPTKHAVGLKSKAGIEYLIHIGLETVALDGKGFEAHVKQGDKVKKGELLITADLDYIAEEANTITPFVITSEQSIENKAIDQTVKKGETKILTVKL